MDVHRSNQGKRTIAHREAGEMIRETTLTLASPRDVDRFTVGETIWLLRLPWYRRAWNWLLRALRIHGYGYATVTHVDHANGIITIKARI